MIYETPSVEVIVVNYKNKELTEKCMDSLSKVTYPNMSVTLVDNGSADGSKEMFRGWLKKYPFIKNLRLNEENQGFSGGNNAAMKASTADYVCLLNNDTEVEPHWLDHLVEFMEQHPDAGMCQPKVKSMRDKKMFEHAGAAGGFIDIFGYPFCRGRVFDHVEADSSQYDAVIESFWACGVAILIRREVIEKIGVLDEDFFVYAEEVDFNWRAHLAGYNVYCVPQSVIYHWGRATTTKTGTKYEYLLHRNHFLLLLKNYSLHNLLWIVPCKIALELMAFAAFLPKNRAKSFAIVQSIWWIITHPRKIWRMRKIAQAVKTVKDKFIMRKMIKSSVALESHLLGRNHFKDYEARCKW